MLEDLGPLVPNMKDIVEDDILDLSNVRGIDDRFFFVTFLIPS